MFINNPSPLPTRVCVSELVVICIYWLWVPPSLLCNG